MKPDEPAYEEAHVLGGKVRLLQPESGGYRTAMDAVLLAAACPARSKESVLDIGCGVGAAGLCLLSRVEGAVLTGIDCDPEILKLARGSAASNNRHENATFLCTDLREFRPEHAFDAVITNPPYLEPGCHTPSPDPQRARALGHTDPDMSLDVWIHHCARLVKPKGSLTVIHRADMVDRLIRALGTKFGAIEIIPLWPRAATPAGRVIIRARKGRKTPATIHPGLILHESDGAFTPEAETILRNGAAL